MPRQLLRRLAEMFAASNKGAARGAGLPGSDPATFATIAVILIATGLIACVVPGSRAARVDPLVALRHE